MKATRKIYILISDLGLGGAERVMLALAKQFAQTHDVEFICLRKNGALLAELPENTSVRFLNSASSGRMPLVVHGFLGIRKIFYSDQTSIIISTGTGTSLLACTARLFAPKGTSLIIREACSSKNSKNWMISLLKRFLYSRADGCIGVSDGVAKELAELTHGKVAVASIPNPIDVVKTKQLAESIDDPLANFPHSYVLTVGRLVSQKNTAMLIDAYAVVADAVIEHLVIIGAGPLEAKLRERIGQYGLNSKIHLLGEIANPNPWYKRASMFALSSDSEGYPNVLLEALVHGLPIVSTDCDFGPRQILENGCYGKLVKVGDVDGMANAIQTTLKGNTAFDIWDAERFNSPAIAARYLAFMESC